jgi:hypothetical protein
MLVLVRLAGRGITCLQEVGIGMGFGTPAQTELFESA